MAKWIGDVIDTKIEKIMDIIKLPSREQVAKLDENIKELNKKIDALTLSQGKVVKANTEDIKTHDTPKKTDSVENEKNNSLTVSFHTAA